jgi:hypothetical protein
MLFTLHIRGPENSKLYFAADFFVKTKSHSRYLCGSQRTMNLTRVTFISQCDVFKSSQQASPEHHSVSFHAAIARRATNTPPLTGKGGRTSQRLSRPAGLFSLGPGLPGVSGHVFSLDKLSSSLHSYAQSQRSIASNAPQLPAGCSIHGDRG